jgi:UMF1 family MFS transporter
LKDSTKNRMTSYNASGSRKEIFVWTLYDFANTAFSVIVVTVVYAVYFKEHIVSKQTISFLGVDRNPGDLFWGISGAVSMLIVALSAPVIGAIADYSNKKKEFLFSYSIVCIISTIMLYYLEPGMIWQGMLLFIIGNVGFESAIVFYNGFLPQISRRENIGKISGYGFAFGYVGSLISLVIALPYANMAFEANNLSLMRPTFVWAGLFFLVFSLPFYTVIHEKNMPQQTTYINSFIREGFRRVRLTFKRVKEFPEIVKFLTAYFIYIDGVNTVIYFSGIYASDTLGFSLTDVIKFFAIVQFSAIIGSYVFGFLTDRIGAKNTIILTLLLWITVSIGAFVATGKLSFYIVGLIAGTAMGSSQSASRALIGNLIPEGMEAEFFGFYALTGKFSSILGPVIFGLTSTVTGSQRFAVLSILIFFLTGLFLINRVNEKVTYKNVTI